MRVITVVFACAMLSGCVARRFYPEPQTPEPPPCAQEVKPGLAVVIDAEPESALCGLARRRVQAWAQVVAPAVSTVSLERLRGFVIVLNDPDAKPQPSSFYSEFWEKQVAGETDCTKKRIRMANFFSGIPHELTHGGEGCPKKPGVADRELALHPDWDSRGVYTLLFEADSL